MKLESKQNTNQTSYDEIYSSLTIKQSQDEVPLPSSLLVSTRLVKTTKHHGNTLDIGARLHVGEVPCSSIAFASAGSSVSHLKFVPSLPVLQLELGIHYYSLINCGGHFLFSVAVFVSTTEKRPRLIGRLTVADILTVKNRHDKY